MKFSKLLVLGALWFTAGSAMATIVDGVRQIPVPAPSAAYQEGDTIYLYNLGAAKFFSAGNDWGTRASVLDEGRMAYFVSTDAAHELGEDVVELKNDVKGNGNFISAFAGGVDDVWTDNNGRADRFWKVTAHEGFYRISNVVNATDKFLGWNYSAKDTRLYLLDANNSAAYVDWIIVPKAEYDEFKAKVADAAAVLTEAFYVARILKGYIDDATSSNINVTDETNVYLNESATVDELNAAIESIKEKIKNAAEQNATVDNPQDMTSLITNPNGDNGNNGWKGTAPAMQYTVFETYNATFNTYQDLSKLPKGVYAVNVHAFHRQGSTAEAYAAWQNGDMVNAFVYAKAGEDSVAIRLKHIFAGANAEKIGKGSELGPDGTDAADQECYVPNNREAAQQYFLRENDPYLNSVLMATGDGNMRIGIGKNVNINYDWTPYDTWTLTYFGSKPESYQYWVNTTKASLPIYEFTPFDFETKEGTPYTEAYLTAYEALRTAQTTPSTYEEASAEVKAINDAVAALEKNIALWKQLQTVIAAAIEVGADETLDPDYTGDIAEWGEFDGEEILKAHELTNEELETLITEKKAEIEEARKHPKGTNVDMTSLLTNPDFEQGETGWTGFNSARRVAFGDAPMPVTGGTATNTCAEAFSTTEFDLYQIVTNAPVGVYEISVQGFCRHGRGDVAWNNYQNQSFYSQPGKFPVYVYLNAKKTPFKSVFEEPVEEGFYKGVDSGSEVYVKDGMEFPDGMKSSAVAFANGMYKQKAIGLVAREGDSLRIGVKGHSNGLDGEDDNWVIFDNFKLTWKGYQADIIKPALEEELAKAQERVNETMGKTAYTHLMTAIGSAQSALQGEDGEVMFNALSALFEVDDEVTESVEAFKDLAKAMELLSEEIGLHTDSPALEEAANLMDEISGNIGSHVYDEADVETLVAKINEMIVKLRIPVYNVDDITDLNPVEFKDVITNPSYDENLDGWTYEVKDVQDENNKYLRDSDGGNVQFYRCNYDYYQEISGLPAGIYRVAVTGFFRSGSAAEEWARKDSVKYSRAFIYAIGENGTMNNKALARLSENYVETSAQEDGYAVVKTDTVPDTDIYNYTLLADNQKTAGEMFFGGAYVPDDDDVVTGEGNVVTVKVGADGKLRFGLYKKVTTGNLDWTVWDDWKLWYFGPNSALLPSGDNDKYEEEQGIAIVNLDKAVRVETFTLDGRKVTSKQRGIVIQRMTMPDGSSVVIKKIRK